MDGLEVLDVEVGEHGGKTYEFLFWHCPRQLEMKPTETYATLQFRKVGNQLCNPLCMLVIDILIASTAVLGKNLHQGFLGILFSVRLFDVIDRNLVFWRGQKGRNCPPI